MYGLRNSILSSFHISLFLFSGTVSASKKVSMAEFITHKDRHTHFISSHSAWYVTVCLKLITWNSALGDGKQSLWLSSCHCPSWFRVSEFVSYMIIHIIPLSWKYYHYIWVSPIKGSYLNVFHILVTSFIFASHFKNWKSLEFCQPVWFQGFWGGGVCIVDCFL